MFGQEKISGGELRSLVVVGISADSAKNLLVSLEKLEDGRSIADYGRLLSVQSETIDPILLEPMQTVGMRANHVMVALSQEDSVLDFYQATAFVQKRQNKNFFIEPVVRVEIRLSLFLGLIAKLKTLVPS